MVGRAGPTSLVQDPEHGLQPGVAARTSGKLQPQAAMAWLGGISRPVLELFSPGLLLSFAVVGVTSAALFALIRYKSDSDMTEELAHYRTESQLEAERAAGEVAEKLHLIQQGLRTITLLPGVRRIASQGSEIDADSEAAIQQLYNNLKSNVDISEVYIVPADIDPDRPEASQEPIMAFDELIVNAAARARERGELAEVEHEEDDPEVEIFEYRALRDQMTWLRENHPTDAAFAGLDRPMISTAEMITCDNTVFIHTRRDEDRSGIILSVPFYGLDGTLHGAVSAIVRTGALVGYLPQSNAGLLNTAHGFNALSSEPGVERLFSDDLLAGRPSPDLLYSAAVKLVDHDARGHAAPTSVLDARGSWILWAGRPNSDFFSSGSATSIKAFENLATAIAAVFTLLALIGLVIMRLYLLRRTANEAALADALYAAEAASRAKSAFLANMSHEIRTPLNGVLGMAQVLESQKLSAEARPLVETIRDSGNSLVAMLNDVLDLSKIEAGKVDLSPEDTDFRQVMRRVERLYTAAAAAKGIALKVEIDASVPERLSFDAMRMQQCVSNLVANAIKFTESGTVSVSANCQPLAGGVWMAGICVADTGIGINEDAVGKLFQVFTQADESTTRRFGGTGLGLAISRKLARLMGGDITVASIPGRGSAFTFNFVAHAAADPPRSQPLNDGQSVVDFANLDDLRVLVVDDNPLNRKVVRLLLAPHHAWIVEAENGLGALEQLDAGTFDIVLLDAHMPVMDGATTIKRIRESMKPWSQLPVIALTADAMNGDREKYLKMGMSGYASKPVTRVVLLTEMSKVLGDRPAKSAERTAGTSSSPEAAGADQPASSLADDDLASILGMIDRASA
jgi:signal transduction histidine kinase/DNA-binding NarL/FixJ family response regulator